MASWQQKEIVVKRKMGDLVLNLISLSVDTSWNSTPGLGMIKIHQGVGRAA